jgi:hypothetical protein
MKHVRLPLLLSLLVVGAAGSVPTLAHAGPPPVFVVSDKTASDRADELVKRALTLAAGSQEHYPEAEPLLRQAWDLKHSYDIAANLGIVEAGLGKWRDAAEHLAFALKNFPANGKPEHRKLGELTLAKALAQVTALTIKTNVAKAEVFVDGKSVGVSPLPEVVFLDPGTRTIEAKKPGYSTASRVFEAQKGESSDLTLVLQEQAPPPPPTGTPPTPPPGWKPGPAVFVPMAVLAAAGIAAGAGLTVAANGKSADERSLGAQVGPSWACAGQPPASIANTCATLQSAGSSRVALSKAAVGSFVAGGVFALGTAGLALWRVSARGAPPPVRVAPTMGANGAGVVLEGTW